jgi:hypothetical protein
MPKKSQTPSRPRDMNQLAHRIGALATHEIEEDKSVPVDTAAARRGDARAAKLSPKRRSQIAKKAARARWGTKKGGD